MTSPGASFLRADSAEDRALEDIVWPRMLYIGVPLVGLCCTATVIVAALLGSDDGARNVDPAALALVALSATPWVLRLASRSYWSNPHDVWNRPVNRVEVALVAVAALHIASWRGGVDLGSPVAYQLLLFPLLLVVVLQTVGQPRRVAAVVAAAGFGIQLLGINQWADRPSGFDWTGVVTQSIGFVFAVFAAIAVRQGVLGIDKAKRALTEQAAADERRRIARDVHDVVAHSLTVTMLHMTAARMAISRGEPDAAVEALEEAERHGRSSLTDIRQIVRLLRADDGSLGAPQPDLLDIAALMDGCRAAGLPIEATIDGDLKQVMPIASSTLYRVLQEALSNAARHGSGPAKVDVHVGGEEVRLTVENGVRGNDAPGGSGSGLVGMRERVDAVGGELSAGRENEQWVVRARIPCQLLVSPELGVSTTASHPIG